MKLNQEGEENGDSLKQLLRRLGEGIPPIRFSLFTKEVPTLQHWNHSTLLPGTQLPFYGLQSLCPVRPLSHTRELLDASHTGCCFLPKQPLLRSLFFQFWMCTLYLLFTSFSQETFPDLPPSYLQWEIIISSFHYVLYVPSLGVAFYSVLVLYLLIFISSPLSHKVLKLRPTSVYPQNLLETGFSSLLELLYGLLYRPSLSYLHFTFPLVQPLLRESVV